MSTFDEIRKKISEDLAAKEETTPVSHTTPTPTRRTGYVVGMVGSVVSLPGSEKVVLDGSSFQFMECESLVKGRTKKRYCIVEKGVPAKYSGQFVNALGDRVHVLTHDAWLLLLGVVSSAGKQIKELTRDLKHATEQKDNYKLVVDALRKNGIID